MKPLFLSLLLVFSGVNCFAEFTPDYEHLATAIYHAEGGSRAVHKYGIMTHYKTTTPRQACINTCRHAFKDYARIASKHDLKGFIAFLGARYCPTKGLGLRPAERALNGNWIGNVTKLYGEHNG